MPYKCTACDKSFRYKVSQRTHKCLAQPPGEVIRQTGDLLQRLIQSAVGGHSPESGMHMSENDHMQLGQSSFDDTQLQTHGHQLELLDESKTIDDVHQFSNQSLDDLLAEQCHKFGIGEDGGPSNEMTMTQAELTNRGGLDTQIPSPSDQFQHMCLSSLDDVAAYSGVIETIDDTALKHFLFGNEKLDAE